MHNLKTVFWFEVIRTLKKKSFWLISLSFPIMIGVIFTVVVFANKATDQAANDAKNQTFTFLVTDRSNLLNRDLLRGFNAELIDSRNEGIEKVRAGQIDAYFYYPAAITKANIEIYAKDVGLFDNSRYEAVAKLLLNRSVAANVADSQTAVLEDKVSVSNTTYRNGQTYDGFKQLIAPGLFLTLFYLLIAVFGNQMLTSTTEEKENRVIEMILTMVRARVLIIGKILSLIALGFIQSAIVLLPIVVAYLLLHDRLDLPSVDLQNIPLDPLRIGIGAILFSVSFVLFTGLLVMIGAAAPTAKEAGGFFGVVMMLIFGPLYAAPLFVSSPDSPVVQTLSYVPFTAPIPLMLRNAVGNLELWQAGIALILLLVSTLLVLHIAVRVFRRGALEYSRKLSFKEIINPGT